MTPIRKGDGTDITPKGIAEVRKGDGTVLYSAGSEIPDSGVARYEFEQDVTDSWGDNDGIDNTSAGYTTDSAVGDYAKNFDGVDDAVNTGLEPLNSPVSYAFWLDTSASSGGNNSVTRVRDSTNRLYIAFDADDNEFNFYTYDGSVYGISNGGPSLNLSGYTHVICVHDGTEYRIYIDGQPAVTDQTSNYANPTGYPIHLMARNYEGAIDSYHGGILDDVRIYSKGLTDSEANNLYTTGSISG